MISWLTDWLTDWLATWLPDWLIDWLTYQLTNFSTSELQKAVRTLRFFNILTCKCASRHSAVPVSRLELAKSVRALGVLCILTWKCASHHSGGLFFRIGTTKIAPALRCFVHVDLQMRFAPQRRGIFRPAALASLLFQHQEPRIIEKTQRFVTFLAFGACVSSFYWLYSRVDLLSSDLTSLVCFSTVHLVRS